MGKVLIIKGADFSANGMQAGTITDITSLFTLTKNYNFGGAMSSGATNYNKTLNLVSPVDLSAYIQQGYTTMLLTRVSQESPHSIAACNCDSSRGNRSPQTPAYTTGTYTLQLNASLPYVLIGVLRTDGNTYGSNSYAASAIMTVQLVKP